MVPGSDASADPAAPLVDYNRALNMTVISIIPWRGVSGRRGDDATKAEAKPAKLMMMVVVVVVVVLNELNAG